MRKTTAEQIVYSGKIVLIPLGKTGQGKSSLLNAALGCHDKQKLKFKQGDSYLSCTVKMEGYEENLLGE
jgi:predicted GTPase